MAAPATTSQTSLPSHSGPIVLMATRRPVSSLPTRPCSMPTPKSKPSRMKKPVHSTAMAMNQKSASVMTSSVDVGRLGGLRFVAGGRRQGFARVAQHQYQRDDRECRVEQKEDDKADRDRGGAHRWR